MTGLEAGILNAYVVLKQFTFPAGLHGANAAIFYVPKGVPGPAGNPGHSRVYDFNTMECTGGSCGISVVPLPVIRPINRQ